ncbi:hypothetical protein FACS1894170_09160 [Planctomycetales bacterium]|nr:hypothetical protein FACS1894170_09160 [Planctomycetales bacterium]
MVNRKKKDVESALIRKGFVCIDDGDHRFFHFPIGNRKILHTKTSRGTKTNDLGDDLISLMSRQCHLTKGQFLELVDCPMSKEQYEKILCAKEPID